MSRFWSPIVERLVPYTPGEQPKDQVFIKLNTNENPYGPSPEALKAIAAASNASLRLYPDPAATELRQAVAKTFDLTLDHVFVGNGSDDVLAHAFNAFFTGKQPILFADVTYSFYRTYCQLYDIRHRLVPLDHAFENRVSEYQGPSGGIVIANPNAPTGIDMGMQRIEQIVLQNPDTVVIIDEAYVDFGAESAASLVQRFENLIVVQTLSKSRSLAGLRVGFAIAQPALIEGLKRIKDSFNSYPIGHLSQQGALAAWCDTDWFEKTRRQVMTDREVTSERLRELGFHVLPSAANFVFVSHDRVSAEVLKDNLRECGILIRHFNQPRVDNWLRISIGTREDCDKLLTSMADILSVHGH